MFESALRLAAGGSPGTSCRSEMLLASQAQVLEVILSGRPLGETLRSLSSIAEAQAGGALCAIIFLWDPSGKQLRIAAAPSLSESDIAAINGIAACDDQGPWAAAQRRAIVTSDIASDPRWTSVRRFPRDIGQRAAWSMPIMASAGSVLGTFDSYINECREPTAHELQLCEVLTRTLVPFYFTIAHSIAGRRVRQLQ
jgi:GAF domain-containing protein